MSGLPEPGTGPSAIKIPAGEVTLAAGAFGDPATGRARDVVTS